MMNPWAKDRKQIKSNKMGQAPAQVDLNAAGAGAVVGSSGFQLSSLPIDPDLVAPLGTDNTIKSLPDNSKDTNAVPENSYPGLNTPSLDTTQGGNFVAPSDFGEDGYWQKGERSSKSSDQRRRRAVTR